MSKSPRPLYQRILLKLSGESLCGEGDFGIDLKTCETLGKQIKELSTLGIQIGIVLGGGNLFRGVKGTSMNFDRVSSDHIGMMATIMNGLFLQQVLKNLGLSCKVLSALPCPQICETYQQTKALQYLLEGTILIFVGGTGLPFFTTDTSAALKACEIEAEILLKATKVDGVYDKDPLKYPDAKKFAQLTFGEALEKNVKVMDATAFALCRENNIPVYVFNLFKEKALYHALMNTSSGSLVKEE